MYVDGMTEATELAAETASTDPATGLRAVASLRALLESLEELQVENARTTAGRGSRSPRPSA